MKKEEKMRCAARAVVDAFDEGQKILIIGYRSTNFSSEDLSDETLVFWKSTSVAKKNIPADIGTVLFTRFLTHARSDQIVSEAQKRAIPYFGPLSTGSIKKILDRARAEEEEDLGPEQIAPATISVSFAGITDFLVDQVSGSKLQPDLLCDEAEIDRLHKLTLERWPGISRKRVVRGLRRCLAILDIGEAADSVPTDSEAAQPSVAEPAQSQSH
ncbi:MAG: hypothetical protein Q8P45_00580, partial [Candidatus Harrisonbacteria bacterium]|nr:hypothetical protein [Candidatus Harrisonbacteria bacterium]